MVMREIRITPVLNGFIVNVGCQALVYTDIEEVAKDLVGYHKNTAAMEKAFISKAVNPTMGGAQHGEPLNAPVEAYNGQAAVAARW